MLNIELDEAGNTIESNTKLQGRVVGSTPMFYVEPPPDDEEVKLIDPEITQNELEDNKLKEISSQIDYNEFLDKSIFLSKKFMKKVNQKNIWKFIRIWHA